MDFGDVFGYVTWHAPRREEGRLCCHCRGVDMVLREDQQQHCTERMTRQGPRARNRRAGKIQNFEALLANGCTAKGGDVACDQITN